MLKNSYIATFIFCFSIVIYSVFAQNISIVSREVKFIQYDAKLLPENLPFYDNTHNKHYFDEMDQQTILLVLWASWLPESPELLRKLHYLAKDFRKLDFTIIALSEDYLGIDSIEKFFKQNDIRHIKIYYDYKNAIYNHIGIKSLPAFFLITSKGEEFIKICGNPKWDQDAIRNTLLGYIPGNPPIQKNTYDKSSLNIIFNSSNFVDKEMNNTEKSLSNNSIQGKTKDNGKKLGK